MNKEDLCIFCDPTTSKMCGPFSFGAYTYATNGHILVRVPRLSEVAEWEALNQKSAVLFDERDLVALSASLVDLPEFEAPDPVKCRVCKGTGKSMICPECEGEGDVDFGNDYNSYSCECKSCWGDGLVSGGNNACTACNGTGTERVMKRIAMGDTGFSVHYLNLMKEKMPGVKIAPTEPENANYFRWDGGDGLLMPMRLSA